MWWTEHSFHRHLSTQVGGDSSRVHRVPVLNASDGETNPSRHSALCSDKTLQQWNCRLQFSPVSQRPESELKTFPKKALKVAGTCGNGKINWASVPSWPQDWTMVCTMVGWCVIIRRPRQAFPKAPLMSLNCKSAQLNIPGKWNTTFTVLLPLHTFLLLICNDLQLQYSVKKSFPYSLDD